MFRRKLPLRTEPQGAEFTSPSEMDATIQKGINSNLSREGWIAVRLESDGTAKVISAEAVKHRFVSNSEPTQSSSSYLL
jgi:uncharacterized protein (AIM24 family)